MNATKKTCRWQLDEEEGWRASCGRLFLVAMIGERCPQCGGVTYEAPALSVEPGGAV
jgi:hypothetical protein